MGSLLEKLDRNAVRPLGRAAPIGVDLGTDAIRAVQLEPVTEPGQSGPVQYRVRSRVESHRSDVPEGQSPDVETLTLELTRLLERGGFRGRDLVLGMDPPELSTVALNMPLENENLDDPSVQTALAFELSRHLGYDPADAEILAWRLPPGGAVTPTLIGAAARRDLVLERVEAVEAAGFRCRSLDAGACALVRCCCALANPPRDAIWGMMDIGLDATRLIVASQGVPILQREIQVGGRIMTEHVARQFSLSSEAAQQLKHDYGLADTAPGNLDADPESSNGTDDRIDTRDGSHDEADDVPVRGAAETRIARMIFSAVRRDVGALAVEAERSMAYGMHVYPDLPVSTLYLVGGGAALSGLVGVLARDIGIGVELLDPLAILEPGSRGTSTRCGTAWGKAVGLALTGA